MTSPTPAAGAQKVDPEKARATMQNAFEEKKKALAENAAYYNSERRPSAIGIATPPEMRDLLAHVGYPRLYIDALANRMELEGFRLGGADKADTELWDWWQANDLDVEAPLGHTDAFVNGRAYVTIAQPDPKVDLDFDPKVPIIRVESANSLYAQVDPRTRRVSQAIRVIYDEEGTKVLSSTLYLPDATYLWELDASGQLVPGKTISHGLGIVPVVPLTNRTLLSDLYGTSEITPELRSVTDAAARILMDMQATAEAMAVPLRLLFGVKPHELGIEDDDEDEEPSAVNPRAAFEAYYARILAFEEPEGKGIQLSAAELRNFVDALDALDKKAAAYTGLPPQYLAFSSDSPASAEAIKASESRLVKNAERKNSIFGGGWEQVMRTAYRVMKGGKAVLPPQYYRMESIWRDPSTPTYAAKADAASKLYNGGAGVIPRERARMDMGYSVAERTEMEAMDAKENPLGQMASLYGRPSAAPGTPAPAPAAKPPAAAPAAPAA